MAGRDAMFVPAHAEASADIKELVYYNRDKIHEVVNRILSICKEPICFERILQEVFKGYGLSMNFEQYVLVGSTVRSYLLWLAYSERWNEKSSKSNNFTYIPH